MDEPRGQAQRVASEASRKMQESTRDAAKVVNKLADKGAQTSAALTEANQRVMNEFMGLSMETFQESARLLMQIQQSALDMMRESQAAALGHGVSQQQDAKDSGGLPGGIAGNAFDIPAAPVTLRFGVFLLIVAHGGMSIHAVYACAI